MRGAARPGRRAPRPWWTVVALLVVAALVAAACGGDSDSSTAAGDDCPVDALDDVSPEDGPVEITVWHTFVGLPSDTPQTFDRGFRYHTFPRPFYHQSGPK